MRPEERRAREVIEEYLTRYDQPYDRQKDWETVLRVHGLAMLADKNRSVEDLVFRANSGDVIAWEACAHAIDNPNFFGITQSEKDVLRNWATSVIRGEVSRPKKSRAPTDVFRNHTIMMAVYRAMKCGLPEYASGDAKGTTACSLVAEYMHLSPDTVKTIWRDAKSRLGEPD